MSDAITMYRGDSYPILVTCTNKAAGTVLDLTGTALIMSVDTRKDPTDESTQLFQVSGVLDDDPTTGRVTFTPTITNTDLAKAKYYYDISITSPQITKKTIVKSTFSILTDIGKD